jgi:hypothetical protein
MFDRTHAAGREDKEVPMNEDEAIANEFLKSLNIGGVCFEPYGNIPPDFQVDGRKIGVEVRRLNQNHVFPDGEKHAYEHLGIRMWHRMTKLLKQFGPSYEGESWHVTMTFRRPLDWRRTEMDVVSQLDNFKQSDSRADTTLKFGDNFELDLDRARKDVGSFFNLWGSCDGDAGGAILAEVERNLRLCIEEKERKTAPYRDRYDEWWLVLINYVDLHMEAEDYETFIVGSAPPIAHSFNRIILIDFRDYRHWFEVHVPSTPYGATTTSAI